jgi:ElaB/YqjD/DUF883 family membrane-anchored ribosome-binding protein
MRTKKTVTKHHFDLEDGKRKIADMQEALKEAAYDAREKLYEAKDKLVEVEKNVTTYTKANPLKAMGFSLLAGAVIGQLLRLRK